MELLSTLTKHKFAMDVPTRPVIYLGFFSYVEISAVSTESYKFMDADKTDLLDKRLVGKMMVTNNTANLEDFYSNPKAALDGAIRLSRIKILFTVLN